MAETTSSGENYAFEINSKINNLEEKSNLLREKLFALDETFFALEEKFNKEISLVKEDVKQIKEGTERLSESINGILRELTNLARKEEVIFLEKTVKMWDPLKFVKSDEVMDIVKEEIEKHKEEEKPKTIHTHIG
jgi:hypothetical protein